MRKNSKVELRMEDMELQATELGEESSLPDILGEAVLQNNLVFELDEEDEIFEGYGRRENAYPYRQYNTYSKELERKSVKAIILENRYLKATFLPEFGGRLWSLIDKETGKNLLYTNDVLRFRNLAVRNAWFSGGVEWNIGVIGHSPLTTAPLYVAETADDKGNPVLRMYEYERIRKVYYQMDFWLGEEDRFLNCRMRVVNESEQVVPMYWWSNMAVPEFDGGRIIVPAEKAFTFADGKVTKVELPFVDGVDITHYNGIPKSVDYFFDIPEKSPKYIANVDKNGYGLLQLSTGRLKGRKLFSWGHGTASRHWQEFLTENAGDYVEIQAGLAKTQYGCLPMAPHTAWEWMEQYGSIQISPEQLEKTNLENSMALTRQLFDDGRILALENKLKETKTLAKSRGTVLMNGSGYGALMEQGSRTGHLEFSIEKESLKNWRQFFKTGVLHEPDPQERPDEFWDEEAVFALLKEKRTGETEKNWYAHYQLGICYYVRKQYKKAKRELKASYALKRNPWACHALGCIYLRTDRREKAIAWILCGLQMRRSDASYLKEGFKILFLCGGYEAVVECFERLDEAQKVLGRLRFYYISAKYHLGEYKEAFALLEADGGLEMEDIREGEDSVELLWEKLSEAAGDGKREVPYRYRFKTF